MRVVPSTGVARRGLLALVLASLAFILAPGAPAVSPSPEPASWAAGWTASWSGSWTYARPARRVYVTGVPLALRIPSIGVVAVVEPVVADAGVLVPPVDPTLVGWWAGSARAGARTGAVVLAGHTVRSGGGVFDDLADVRPGDTVRVDTPRGRVTYVVAVVRDLSKQQLAVAAQELFAGDGHPRLVLVTCTDWAAGRYFGNTVVVAVPDEQQQR